VTGSQKVKRAPGISGRVGVLAGLIYIEARYSAIDTYLEQKIKGISFSGSSSTEEKLKFRNLFLSAGIRIPLALITNPKGGSK